MTGKLMKYECRSMFKQMSIIWVALPILAVFASFANWVIMDEELISSSLLLSKIIVTVTNFAYGAIFVALIAVTALIIIMRFYKGLLKDEGYLMHTLPVKTWQLITAKGAIAVLTIVISVIVAGISVMLMNVVGGLGEVFDFIGDIFSGYRHYPIAILYTVEVLVLLLAMALKWIYQVYAGLSIGQLAARHKIALSVAAYLGIGMAMTILLIIFMQVVGTSGIEWLFDDVFRVEQAEEGIQVVLIGLTIIQLVQVVILHVVSEQLLAKKLNLE